METNFRRPLLQGHMKGYVDMQSYRLWSCGQIPTIHPTDNRNNWRGFLFFFFMFSSFSLTGFGRQSGRNRNNIFLNFFWDSKCMGV